MSFTVGIDVGGTKVLGGVVDEAGVVHRIARRDTPKAGGAELIAAIAAVANGYGRIFRLRQSGFQRPDLYHQIARRFWQRQILLDGMALT